MKAISAGKRGAAEGGFGRYKGERVNCLSYHEAISHSTIEGGGLCMDQPFECAQSNVFFSIVGLTHMRAGDTLAHSYTCLPTHSLTH